MYQNEVSCPHCNHKIAVEVEMYKDSGDVCYDLFVDEEATKTIDPLTEITHYQCLSCKKYFLILLDEDFWGSENIPLHTNSYKPKNTN